MAYAPALPSGSPVATYHAISASLIATNLTRVVTTAERGHAGPEERPEFACVGTNAMNEYNVSRATQGLAQYCIKYRRDAGLSGKPRIVFAHDTRHFSTEFAKKCAQIATDLCEAYFDALDVPSVDGFNVWLVTRFQRQQGYKVALSGLG